MRTPRLGQQATEILQAMLEGRAVTPMDALREFHSWRLAARVRDLKENGWNVRSRRVNDGERTFAEYHIPLDNPRIVDAQLSMFGEDESHD